MSEFGLPRGVVKGCFPVSGVFDVTDTPVERRKAFLPDTNQAVEASPIYNISGNTTPFFLEIGENDYDNLRNQHVVNAEGSRV